MRTVITGQIGMDKKPYLEEVERLAGERGGNIDVFNVGQMMYSEGYPRRSNSRLATQSVALTATCSNKRYCF